MPERHRGITQPQQTALNALHNAANNDTIVIHPHDLNLNQPRNTLQALAERQLAKEVSDDLWRITLKGLLRARRDA